MNKEKNKQIFLNDLPRKRKIINWQASIGYKVKFIYNDIKGEIKIINYNKGYLYIQYLDKKIVKIKTNNFQQCQLGKLLNRRTNEFKIDIGTHVQDEKRNLTIIDREYRKSKSNGQQFKYYKYKCNKCGYEGWVIESDLLKGQSCTCCGNFKKNAVLGINTIWDTDRWMCDLGVSEEDAKRYTHSSGQKITVICPNCGNVKNNISIDYIYVNHSIGCVCGDSISYSEKFMYNLLNQLKINFEYQQLFNWLNNDNKKYDFYIPDLSIIIETNGIQHYVESNRGRSLEQKQSNDKLKKELAINNGIKEENYIVIDCRKSELEWIKNNILKSELNNIFDLNKIDWLQCHEFAISNLVKKVCDIKRNNPNITTSQIKTEIKLCISTIIKYLKQGNELGWCNYNPKEEMIKNSRLLKSKQVQIFKNNILLGSFESCAGLERQSEELFGVKLLQNGISEVARGHKKQYKGYIFKYK